jgi:hypothetical protein
MNLARTLFLALPFILPSLLLAGNPSRQWTNTEGVVIEAELAGFDGSVATLIKGGKEFRLPAAKLSEEDRKWLTEWKDKRTKLTASLIGSRQGAPISHRYGTSTDDYFSGPFGKRDSKFYDTNDSNSDDGKKVQYMKCDESEAWKDQTMVVYCPSSYQDGTSSMGVYINISAGDNPIALKEGYDKVMDKRRMIYASPTGTSNSQSDVRRMALVLDTLERVASRP